MERTTSGAAPSFDVCLVVPCFNEARRLDLETFRRAMDRDPHLRFVFVDDGSSDGTARVLDALRSGASDRVEVLTLERNRGKAEAVRRGMLRALEIGPRYAGFWDADLATPLDAVPAFVQRLEDEPRLRLVMGSRVKLLGRRIERSPVRHYLGRVFATCVSIVLRLGVYDSQCGAKLFRADPPLMRHLFTEPFGSTWVFDVEILARLIEFLRAGEDVTVEQAVYELPLASWRDVAGSKVKPADFVRAAVDLAAIGRRYEPWKRRSRARLAEASE